MNFPYSSVILADPQSGDFALTHRPEIPITISGPNGSVALIGLVDTGSDFSIFPQAIAELLGIGLLPIANRGASVFGGSPVPLLSGTATLTVEQDDESLRWETSVEFFDFGHESDTTAILGYSGFLEFFTAIFDGDSLLLSLLANQNLPA